MLSALSSDGESKPKLTKPVLGVLFQYLDVPVVLLSSSQPLLRVESTSRSAESEFLKSRDVQHAKISVFYDVGIGMIREK